MEANHLTEHFFRHEYSRLVAKLSGQVGVHHLELIEDAAQAALLIGLEKWPYQGIPEHPTAWLYKVAKNCLVGDIRQFDNRKNIVERFSADIANIVHDELSVEVDFSNKEINDDLLRMLFICCDSNIPEESQVILALKVLCGFAIKEIAMCLYISEANVYKRYSRSKSILRKDRKPSWIISDEMLITRLPDVHKIIYTLFNEGYLSANKDHGIRIELCEEAIRIATLLAEHQTTQTPETYALLSLMHLHTARINGRRDSEGFLFLLDEQDRSAWDRNRISQGLYWLERSATGDKFSQYHAKAGIVAEHCLAESYEETGWSEIVKYYEHLERDCPSAMYRLNRAIAVGEWKGAKAGLEIIEDVKPPAWLAGSHMWSMAFAYLHLKCGNREEAREYFDKALCLAPTSAIKQLMVHRFNTLYSPKKTN